MKGFKNFLQSKVEEFKVISDLIRKTTQGWVLTHNWEKNIVKVKRANGKDVIYGDLTRNMDLFTIIDPYDPVFAEFMKDDESMLFKFKKSEYVGHSTMKYLPYKVDIFSHQHPEQQPLVIIL